MRYNTHTLYEAVTNDFVITQSIEDFLQECVQYGSIGMVAYAIDVLKIVKKRIAAGEKLTLEKGNAELTNENFADYLTENFTEYVTKSVLAEEA